MIEALFRLAEKLACLLPAGRVAGFGCCLGWFYGSVLRYHRRDAFEALERCLPECSPAEHRDLVQRMYRGLGINLVESLRLSLFDEASLERHVVFEGREHILKVLAEGRGALGLTAHIGNWELLAALMPFMGFKASIVVKEFRNPGFNKAIINSRKRFGIGVIERRNALRPCIKALKENQVLGFMLDQNMTRKEGVYVPFFDRLACTTHGLAQMAALSQVPVVPMYSYRLKDGRHKVVFCPPLDPPPDRSPASIRAATAAYTQALQAIIREHPEQWIWIHRRWRTRILPGETDALGWDGQGPLPG